MLELTTKARKWGNSVGILLPKKLGVKPNEEVHIHLEPAKKLTRVKDLFGIIKIKTPTHVLMREIDKDLDEEL